jgi:hypothetical protein
MDIIFITELIFWLEGIEITGYPGDRSRLA